MDPFDPTEAVGTMELGGTAYRFADLTALEDAGLCELDRLPVSIRLLLESVLRQADGSTITAGDVAHAASWEPDVPDVEVPFSPSRVVLQDLTGVPAVVDLAAMR